MKSLATAQSHRRELVAAIEGMDNGGIWHWTPSDSLDFSEPYLWEERWFPFGEHRGVTAIAINPVFPDECGEPVNLELLIAFPHLADLSLSDPRYTASQLMAVGKNSGIRSLTLNHMKIGDETPAAILPMLPNLEDLDLEQTDVSDDAISIILEHPSLKSLNLAFTAVSARALKRLRELPNLKFLDVDDLVVSPSDWEELCDGLPIRKSNFVWSAETGRVRAPYRGTVFH